MKKLLITLAVVAVTFTSITTAQNYLGNLSANPYDANSVANPYGRYGSQYSMTASITHLEQEISSTKTVQTTLLAAG